MSVEAGTSVFERYLQSHDRQYLTEDVVFTDTASGQEYRGREAVAGMLDWIYQGAFDAHAETRDWWISADGTRAAYDSEFVGKHVGDFAGIPATGRDVRVPLCVLYELENGYVRRGRVYFQIAVLLQQLGVAPPPPG